MATPTQSPFSNIGKTNLPNSQMLSNPLNSTSASHSNLNQLSPTDQRFLEKLHLRKVKLEKLLSTDSTSMVQFTYDLRNESSQQQNEMLRQNLQNFATQNPEEGRILSQKFNRTIEQCPSIKNVAIVPIQGLQGLNTRVKCATEALKKISAALDIMKNDSETLQTAASKIRERLEIIEEKHAKFAHRWLHIIRLVEDAAIASGSYELDQNALQERQEIINQSQKEFDWVACQQRLRILRAQLHASGQAVSQAAAPLPTEMTERLYHLLDLEDKTIEEQSTSLFQFDKVLQTVEESINQKSLSHGE